MYTQAAQHSLHLTCLCFLPADLSIPLFQLVCPYWSYSLMHTVGALLQVPLHCNVISIRSAFPLRWDPRGVELGGQKHSPVAWMGAETLHPTVSLEEPHVQRISAKSGVRFLADCASFHLTFTQIILITKIIVMQCRQTAYSKQSAGFILFFFFISKSQILHNLTFPAEMLLAD